MRRHVKASTAGSTQSKATGSGAPAGGATFSATLLACLLALALGAPAAFGAAPTIVSTSTTAVTTSGALLEAEIDPEGEQTTFHFEYGPADCASNPCVSIPTPDGNVGSGSSPVKVMREAEGLTSGTTYHYRVVAANGSGTAEGPDRVFNTYAAPAPSADCPNQTNRVGLSASLPDCRAYEMVSPVEKNGGDIKTLCNINCYRTALNQSSVSGDKFTFSSFKSFGDALSNLYSNQYIATRGAAGWLTRSVNPPHGRTPFSPEFSTTWDLEIQFKAFTGDLGTAWLTDDNDPPLEAGGVSGEINLLAQNTETNTFEQIASHDPGNFNAPIEVQGSNPSGSHVLFESERPLTGNAPNNNHDKLYDFSGGAIDLVSVLPGGEGNPEYSFLGTGSSGNNGRFARVEHAVSNDGSHVFWTSNGSGFAGEGKVYVRIDGETTVPVSESVSAAAAQYWTASTNGSTAIFSTGGDLYRFDVASETPTLVAGETYGVLGASDDASSVYFVSKEDLGAGATAGQRNLYLDREGVKTFIATLSPVDTGEGQGIGEVSGYNVIAQRPIDHASRVSADGSAVAFQSVASLTGYDNTDAENGEPNVEVFIYDADADKLTCASCRPSGARPTGQPLQRPFRADDSPANNNGGAARRWTAAWLTTAERQMYIPGVLSDDGSRLFFNAFDALLPQDTNGQQDVYQWEEQGTGTCTKPGGCLSLISSGQSPKISEFVDATADGRDVFFSTTSSLVPQDPGLIDIYNAREGGGFPPPAAPPNPCLGDACQDVPAAPAAQTASSASFYGAGDPKQRLARNCGAQSRRAAKLNRRAKRLRRSAAHVRSAGRARAMRRRSVRLAKRAKGLSKRASRCRRANRRAGR